MPFNIHASWGVPMRLREAAAGTGAIYELPDLESVPDGCGVYVFGRQFGKGRFSALYIGRAANLRRRVEQQLNSVKLMTKTRDALAGGRSLVYCEPTIKPGQDELRVLKILEEALIAHALSVGHELFQTQGLEEAEPRDMIQWKQDLGTDRASTHAREGIGIGGDRRSLEPGRGSP